MNFLLELKFLSACKKLKNNLFLVLVLSILTLLVIIKKQVFLLIPLILLLVIMFIYNKFAAIFSLIILILILGNYLVRYICYKVNLGNNFSEVVVISKVETYAEYQRVYVKYKGATLYFNNYLDTLYSGDVLFINGNIEPFSEEHLPNEYNEKEKMKEMLISGKIKVNDLTFIKHRISLRNVNEYLTIYINNKYDNDYNFIIEALVVGVDNFFPEDLRSSISLLGISHLFVISGLHLDVLKKGINKLLSKLKLNDLWKNTVLIVVFIIYFIITGFTISVLRVIIGFVLTLILGKFNKALNRLDIISLNAIIVLCINPLYIVKYSFILSYLVVITITIISKYLRKDKSFRSFIFNNIAISLSSMIVSLPVVLSISNDVNLIGFLFNIIYIPFVTYIILPFSFLVFLFPIFSNLYGIVIKGFLSLTEVLSSVSFFKISLVSFPLILILTYFILVSILIKRYRRLVKIMAIILILSILLITNLSPKLSTHNKVYFLDIPNGDSTLILSHYYKTCVMIDTGDESSGKLIVSFLKSIGVRRINAIFITHSDNDHIGGLRKITEEINVLNIYMNKMDDGCLKYNGNKNIFFLKKDDIINVNNLVFHVLWPVEKEEDINNNSMVLLGNIFNKKYLFLADIEQEAEVKLIELYNSFNVFCIKVAHHGSKTSSTNDLLSNSKAVLAIAMNGYRNGFDFPSIDTRNRFSKYPSITFMNTKDYGTICICSNKHDDSYYITSTFS